MTNSSKQRTSIDAGNGEVFTVEMVDGLFQSVFPTKLTHLSHLHVTADEAWNYIEEQRTKVTEIENARDRMLTLFNAHGLAFVPCSELNVGDLLRCDDGFDCLIAGTTHEVKEIKGAKYVTCSQGHHYLAGQEKVRDGVLGVVGFWKLPEDQAKARTAA